MKLACLKIFHANAQNQERADESYVEQRHICLRIPFDQFVDCFGLDFDFFGYTNIDWITTRLIVLT